jgi:hypothetical protein
MSVTLLGLTVYYEDGQEESVTADQRDIVVFEQKMHTGFVTALEAMPVTLYRYLGYQALVRTGRVSAATKQADWSKTVIGVEPEEPANADPGQPEAPED